MSKLATEKIFVLDTSVILHDNDVINSFDELGKIALLNDDLLIVNENEIKIQ